MADKIDLNDIVNIPSFGELKQVIDMLADASKTLNKSINAIKRSTKGLSESLKDNKKELKDTLDAVQKVNDKGLSDMVAKTDKLIASNKALNEQLSKEKKQLAQLEIEQRKLVQAKKTAAAVEISAIKIQKEKERLSREEIKTNSEKERQAQQEQKSITAVNAKLASNIKLEGEKQRLVQKSIKTEKDAEGLRQLKLRGLEKEAKEEQRLSRIRKQKIAQQEKEAAKAEKLRLETFRLNNAYVRLTKQTREAKNKAKQIGAEYGTASKKFKRAAREARILDRRFKALNKSVGDNQVFVGEYTRALGGATKLLGAFGIAGGIQLAIQGFNKMIDVTAEFEQQMARVQAVTGATGAEFEKLQANALKLGASTSKTAQEVGSLQEAFGKLGFSTNEILAATEATLNLSIATQTDLSQAAEVAGTTLRAFGLDASEMGRVTDVMAASFTQSALDITKFRNSMKFVAPVAKAAGVTIEQTSAFLATLADNGIAGSQAGTALRRILGEMAKTGKPAAAALEDLGKQGLTLNDAFDEVGRTAQTALLVLTENTAQSDLLTTSFENSAGAAAEMARVVEDTLTGDIAKLNSAWEGLLLTLSQGGGVFRTVVQGLTKFLSVLQGLPKTQLEATKAALTTVEALKKEGIESKVLLERYKELTKDGVKPTAEEKKELSTIILTLKDTLGDEVVALNASTGALELNEKATENLIAKKFLLANQEAALLKQELAGLTITRQQGLIKLKQLEQIRRERADQAGISQDEIDLNRKAQDIILSRRRTGLSGASTEQLKFIDSNKIVLTQISEVNANLDRQEEIRSRLGAIFTPEQLAALAEPDVPDDDDKPKVKVKEGASTEVKTLSTVNELRLRQAEIQKELNIELAKSIELQSPEKINALNSEFEKNLDLLNSITLLEEKRNDFDAEVQLAQMEEINDVEEERLRILQDQADATARQIHLMDRLRQLIASPIGRGVIEGLKDNIEDVAILAGAEATLRAIQEGKTVQESISLGLQTVIGVKAFQAISKTAGPNTAAPSFKDGGYVDGSDGGFTGNGGINQGIPTMLHGQEHIITAGQTAKYGLQGLSAQGFDNMIESGQLNQFAKVNAGLADSLATNQVVYVNNSDIDYDKLGKAVGDNMPEHDFSVVGTHFVETQKRLNRQTDTVYKNPNKPFNAKYI